jgi:nitroreductase
MYWEHSPAEKRQETKFNNLKDYPEKASHLVIVVMKRTPDTKIPVEEEYAATAAAVQNLLLGAAALSVAAIWSTGGMAHSQEMKAYLGLEAGDKIVAFVYLGKSDEKSKGGIRKIPLGEKIIWK